MPRRRFLSPEFFKDEDLATLPFEARLLYAGLWCYADRDGRLEDRPKYLKAEIFPYDRIDVEKLLSLLSNPTLPDRPLKVFIRRYAIEGKQLIDIPEFLKHQSPHHHEPESKLTPFVGTTTDNGGRSTDIVGTTTDTSDMLVERGERTKERGQRREEGGFDQFWQVYPKRKARADALKAWKKLKPTTELLTTILAAIERVKVSPGWQEEKGKYIPLPATWLNGRRWEDETEVTLPSPPEPPGEFDHLPRISGDFAICGCDRQNPEEVCRAPYHGLTVEEHSRWLDAQSQKEKAAR